MSGHSKWSQIKHRKAATDAKKGAAFSKMGREITLAARDGGPHAESNARLRAALERARSLGIPKDNIERAIARAAGGGEGAALEEVLCEAAGPGGVNIIIEGITDSKNRTINEIKHILSQHHARMAEPGSLMWNFEHIGILTVTQEENQTKTREQIEESIIESGADNFSFSEGAWTIETACGRRHHAAEALRNAGIAIHELTHDYKPKTRAELAPEEAHTLVSLLDKLAEHDDIQEVYTNYDYSRS